MINECLFTFNEKNIEQKCERDLKDSRPRSKVQLLIQKACFVSIRVERRTTAIFLQRLGLSSSIKSPFSFGASDIRRYGKTSSFFDTSSIQTINWQEMLSERNCIQSTFTHRSFGQQLRLSRNNDIKSFFNK